MNASPSTRPTLLTPQPKADFVMSDEIAAVAQRALNYLQAGFPVHLRGPAGTGKTTLALHLAGQIGRPMLLMVGDDEFSTSDLVGGQHGYRYRKVVDRYIHSVLKYEENATRQWTDNRLTTACRHGYTLVYDEFTRSRPEANNVLLTVLEERLLVLPGNNHGRQYVPVHDDFRAVFTSNPQEYVGVHGAQDALLDRMITLDLAFHTAETEADIVAAKSGLSTAEASLITRIVRAYRATRDYDHTPTLRAGVMIGRIAAAQQTEVTADNWAFVDICLDVLASKKIFAENQTEARWEHRQLLRELIQTEAQKS